MLGDSPMNRSSSGHVLGVAAGLRRVHLVLPRNRSLPGRLHHLQHSIMAGEEMETRTGLTTPQRAWGQRNDRRQAFQGAIYI